MALQRLNPGYLIVFVRLFRIEPIMTCWPPKLGGAYSISKKRQSYKEYMLKLITYSLAIKAVMLKKRKTRTQ